LLVVAAPSQHVSYVVAVQPEIKSLKDLVGKPFAISRPGALSQYLLFPALEREGIARNAVTWIPIGGASERRLALVNNRVKGALLHLDFLLAAQRDAKVVALDRVVRTNPDYPHELLVVRKELADKQPAAVTAMTRSIIEACRFMVGNRERTIEIYRKYTGENDTKLANDAYDALLAIRGFGVNGGNAQGPGSRRATRRRERLDQAAAAARRLGRLPVPGGGAAPDRDGCRVISWRDCRPGESGGPSCH